MVNLLNIFHICKDLDIQKIQIWGIFEIISHIWKRFIHSKNFAPVNFSSHLQKIQLFGRFNCGESLEYFSHLLNISHICKDSDIQKIPLPENAILSLGQNLNIIFPLHSTSLHPHLPTLSASLHATSFRLPFCLPHFTTLRRIPLFFGLTSLHFTSRHFTSPPILSASLHTTSRHFTMPPILFASLHLTSRHFTSPPLLFASLHLLSCHFASPPLHFPCLTSCHFTSPPVFPPHFTPLHATLLRLPLCLLHLTPLHATSRCFQLFLPHFTPLHFTSHFVCFTSCHFTSSPVLSASPHATSLYFTSPHFFLPHFTSHHLICPPILLTSLFLQTIQIFERFKSGESLK